MDANFGQRTQRDAKKDDGGRPERRPGRKFVHPPTLLYNKCTSFVPVLAAGPDRKSGMRQAGELWLWHGTPGGGWWAFGTIDSLPDDIRRYGPDKSART